jgi:hypothetical protein
MFTLHGFKNGHYVPLVFGLLPNKKQETYFQFLIDLKEKCKQLNLILEPKEIVVGFESAIHLQISFMSKLVQKNTAIRFRQRL